MRNDMVTPGGKEARTHIHREDKRLHEKAGKTAGKSKAWSILPRHMPTPDRAQRGRRWKEAHKEETKA